MNVNRFWRFIAVALLLLYYDRTDDIMPESNVPKSPVEEPTKSTEIRFIASETVANENNAVQTHSTTADCRPK